MRLHAALPVAFFLPALTACAPDVAETPTFIEDVRPILSANCARCHGATPGGGAPGGFRLDRYGFRAGRRGAADVAVFLAERVRTGDMPRFGPGLSDRQTDTLTRWVEQAEAAGMPPALGITNAAPTVGLLDALPTDPVTGPVQFQLAFGDPDGDAAWARVIAEPTLGDPFVVVEDLETGTPRVSLDTEAWPNGEARLFAEAGDDGGNDLRVELGRITIAHDGGRAPRVQWIAPTAPSLFHTSGTATIVLDPALGANADFVLAISDDGPPAARVVTVIAKRGDVEIQLPPAVADVIRWPLADVPAGPSWRLIATVDDGTRARRASSPQFVVVDGATTETYAALATDVFVPVCGKCHIVDDDFDVLVPVDLREPLTARLRGLLWQKVVVLEEMPPVSARTLFDVSLDATTRARVRAWLEGGAP